MYEIYGITTEFDGSEVTHYLGTIDQLCCVEYEMYLCNVLHHYDDWCWRRVSC